MLQPLFSRNEEIAQQLVWLENQISLLQLEASMLAAELARTGYLDDAGYNSPTDWLRHTCHLTDKVARDRMVVGEQLPRLDKSVEYLRDGEIGYGHMVVMARTASAVGRAFDEDKLLGLAVESTPGKLYYKSLHYRHAIDVKGFEREQIDLMEARRLSLSTAEDGCLLISGILDPVSGAAVRTTLEAMARPSGAHDDRTREQRLADAFVDVATRGTRVQMQVTSSVETLLGLVGAPGAEHEFSLPISSKTVERWACDSSISRVLLKDSVVIDVGRSERTIKGPRRRALIARDKHCRWPGCDRPASWCDGHHVVHWLHGGGGEIQNQVLLCRRHHTLVHEGNWQIVITEDGELMTVAPTVTFTSNAGVSPPGC